jgi:hypothetical protein
MRIFISYAREQVRIAQSIQVRLMEEGHKTFFDLEKMGGHMETGGSILDRGPDTKP